LEGNAGESPNIHTCLTLAQQAAKSDAHVLIRGETGTGKEILVRAIHKNSLRANKFFSLQIALHYQRRLSRAHLLLQASATDSYNKREEVL